MVSLTVVQEREWGRLNVRGIFDARFNTNNNNENKITIINCQAPSHHRRTPIKIADSFCS